MVSKLSELVVFKPTLDKDLDDDRKVLWAEALLKLYSLKACVLAIEQMKNSAEQWVTYGTISTEARRIAASINPVYAPFSDPKRLTVTQLQAACANGNEAAAERIKAEQHQGLKRLERK